MWKRSSFCKADQPMCAEVEQADDGWRHVRSSVTPEQQILLSPDEWDAFVAGVRQGDFD